MLLVVVLLEKEEAVMQQRGVPSLPPSLPQSRLVDLSTTVPFKMTFYKTYHLPGEKRLKIYIYGI